MQIRISKAYPDKLRLRVPRVVPVDARWKQAFAAALAPAREAGAAAPGPHPGAKAVLAFTGSLGWLISAFHKVGPVTRALTLGASPSLSIRSQVSPDLQSCQHGAFLEQRVGINGRKRKCRDRAGYRSRPR